MTNCINCLYLLDYLDYSVCCNTKSSEYKKLVGHDHSCPNGKTGLEYAQEDHTT